MSQKMKERVVTRPSLLFDNKLAREHGMTICPGCQHTTVGRVIAEVLEEMGLGGKAIGVFGIGCISLSLQALLNFDYVGGGHGRPPDLATAIKRLLPEAVVFTAQGDGDCIAIGAGPLIGALTRGEKFTIFMSNNANFGATGGQWAPTTLLEQVTLTTPEGRQAEREGYPLPTAELVAQFRGVAYSARGALTTPANYQRTKRYVKTAFQKQLGNVGLSFVEILSACPTDWHLTPVESLKWIEEKLMAEFPLGEFKNVDRID